MILLMPDFIVPLIPISVSLCLSLSLSRSFSVSCQEDDGHVLDTGSNLTHFMLLIRSTQMSLRIC